MVTILSGNSRFPQYVFLDFSDYFKSNNKELFTFEPQMLLTGFNLLAEIILKIKNWSTFTPHKVTSDNASPPSTF